MAWTSPVTHSTGDILTASDWNGLANDVSFLAGAAFANVATSQATSSTSYTDLGTVGPAVTVTTGANAIVILSSTLSQSTTNDGASMAFAVTGATTIAAPAAAGTLYLQSASGGANTLQASACYPISGLNAGSNTFTAKYSAIFGGTATFLNRTITVLPLP